MEETSLSKESRSNDAIRMSIGREANTNLPFRSDNQSRDVLDDIRMS